VIIEFIPTATDDNGAVWTLEHVAAVRWGDDNTAEARKVSGWPKKCCMLAYAFLWEYSYKGLKLAQLLRRLGVFLT
jgi:hypothetical protein